MNQTELYKSVFRILCTGIVRSKTAPHIPGATSLWKGSCFLINSEDNTFWFMTNNHIAANGDQMMVELPNTKIKVATIARAPQFDVAIVGFIPPEDPQELEAAINDLKSCIPLQFGDSDKIRTSDEILCVGYPGITESYQVSKGMISTLQLSSDDFPYITTDAVANYGNSGGPILDASTGLVIGVLAAGLTTGMRNEKSGINIACPISECVKALNEALKMTGMDKTYIAPDLDFMYTEVTPQIAKALDCVPGGIMVTRTFDGTPIANAGVRAGDIITSINGKKIDSTGKITNVSYWNTSVPFMFEVRRIFSDNIVLDVTRKNEHCKINVKLEPTSHKFKTVRNDDHHELDKISTKGAMIVTYLRSNTIPIPILRNHEHKESKLVVLSVEGESPFKMQPHIGALSLIDKVNGYPVRTIEEYNAQFEKNNHVLLTLMNDKCVAASTEECKKAQDSMNDRLNIKSEIAA